MNIFANTVVTMTFELFDSDGTLLESTSEPITYLHGGHSGMLPKLEEALRPQEDRRRGHRSTSSPRTRSATTIPSSSRSSRSTSLPSDVAVGMQFETFAKPGDEPGSGIVFTVTDIADGKVVLDGNHPWAGKRLRFDCRILDVRAATPEEVEHGHVHGDHGHHH